MKWGVVEKKISISEKINTKSLGSFKNSHKLFHAFFEKHDEYSTKTACCMKSFFLSARTL